MVSPTAREMIDRRREKATLDALGDLVRYLRVVREERKALLVITEGWRLFRPRAQLGSARPAALGDPPAAFDPRRGTLGTLEYDDLKSECERDRQTLAMIDNDDQFRLLLDQANRANASFYPVDPRGLAVFDSGLDAPLSLQADLARLRTKRNLAAEAGQRDRWPCRRQYQPVHRESPPRRRGSVLLLPARVSRLRCGDGRQVPRGQGASEPTWRGPAGTTRIPGVKPRRRAGCGRSGRRSQRRACRPARWRERGRSNGRLDRCRPCRAKCRYEYRWPQAGRPQAPPAFRSSAKSAGTTSGTRALRWM